MRRLAGFSWIVALSMVLGCGGGAGKVELPKNPTPPPPIPPISAGETPTSGSPATPPPAR